MIETLTKFQYRVLRKLARSDIKVYATLSGLPGEAAEDAINRDFNSLLRLTELNLVTDITQDHLDSPIYKQYSATGRDIAILQLTNQGQWMFETTEHDRWVN